MSFSEPYFITVTLTLNFSFTTNLIVIIIHTNPLHSTESTSILFIRRKYSDFRLLFYQRISSLIGKDILFNLADCTKSYSKEAPAESLVTCTNYKTSRNKYKQNHNLKILILTSRKPSRTLLRETFARVLILVFLRLEQSQGQLKQSSKYIFILSTGLFLFLIKSFLSLVRLILLCSFDSKIVNPLQIWLNCVLTEFVLLISGFVR